MPTLTESVQEVRTKLCAEVARFLRFCGDIMPDAAVVVFGLVPPLNAPQAVVQEFRQLSELYRQTAKDNECFFFDLERTLRRGFNLQPEPGWIILPAAWTAGNVVGKPPPVELQAATLPERAYTDDGIHLGRRAYQVITTEIWRLLQAQVRWPVGV